IINWDNDDYGNELGPFVGDMPHVYVAPDENYNYHDMGAFALMWNWYFTNNTLAFTSYEDEGLPITIEAEHDSIYLDIPQDLSAYQVQIQYTPGSFFIGSSDNKDELYLTHEEQELGVYTIMATPGQSRLAIPIEIRGRDASISISYKGITSQGELAGTMTKSLTIENIPDEFVLYSNYPNPFNPITHINYGLPEASNVHLIIYDILGREVSTLVNGVQDAGYKSIIWSGKNALGENVSAGVYFYLIQAGEFRKVRKMVLLK
ncbi:MAG: T9SS type A sorting domain-containing protein, partial [Candidatus Marinimicrobia bacterium]|nr:T9SS type A sorting domain-containing protein [Candidatus Neomarinimicrobiota bacterium]